MRKIARLLGSLAVLKVAFEVLKRVDTWRQTRPPDMLDIRSHSQSNQVPRHLSADAPISPYGRTPQEQQRTIADLLDEPRQHDVPDEARTLPAEQQERGWEEVVERAEKEEAGELPQRGPKS